MLQIFEELWTPSTDEVLTQQVRSQTGVSNHPFAHCLRGAEGQGQGRAHCPPQELHPEGASNALLVSAGRYSFSCHVPGGEERKQRIEGDTELLLSHGISWGKAAFALLWLEAELQSEPWLDTGHGVYIVQTELSKKEPLPDEELYSARKHPTNGLQMNNGQNLAYTACT